ncbi:MAG: sugar isomerase domain-containing protein, partial [Acidobacteriaceae bacterium]
MGLLHRTGESAEQYLQAVRSVLGELELQQVLSAAALVAASLRSGGLIQMFGSGHSLLLAVEVFFRAGGLVAVNPILDRRLQFEGGVIESTEFERTSGAARELARAAGFRAGDVGIVASNSGRNVLPVEIAFQMRAAGMKAIALTNLKQSNAGKSLHVSGKRLFEVVDAVLDNHCPVG